MKNRETYNSVERIDKNVERKAQSVKLKLKAKNEEEGFELSKMAVSPKFQGLKIGQQLMQYCIDFGKKKGWNELILYSNTKLKNAVYIYKKFDFKEVKLETNSPYNRSDIKMVLTF